MENNGSIERYSIEALEYHLNRGAFHTAQTILWRLINKGDLPYSSEETNSYRRKLEKLKSENFWERRGRAREDKAREKRLVKGIEL